MTAASSSARICWEFGSRDELEDDVTANCVNCSISFAFSCKIPHTSSCISKIERKAFRTCLDSVDTRRCCCCCDVLATPFDVTSACCCCCCCWPETVFSTPDLIFSAKRRRISFWCAWIVSRISARFVEYFSSESFRRSPNVSMPFWGQYYKTFLGPVTSVTRLVDFLMFFSTFKVVQILDDFLGYF